MRANLFTLLLLSILTLGVLASENSTTADGDDNNTVYNPFEYTYKFWTSLTKLPPYSQILPVYLDRDVYIDLLLWPVGQNLSWIPDVRGSTANSLVYNISDQAVGTFDVASIKGDSSHDIIYSHTKGTSIILAANPFYQAYEPNLVPRQTYWNKNTFFDFKAEAGKDISLDNYYISALMADRKQNLTTDIFAALESKDSGSQALIYWLKVSGNSVQPELIATLPQGAEEIRLLLREDLDADGNGDLVFLKDGTIQVLMANEKGYSEKPITITQKIFSTEGWNPHQIQVIYYQNRTLPDFAIRVPSSNTFSILLNPWTEKTQSSKVWPTLPIQTRYFPHDEKKEKKTLQIVDALVYKQGPEAPYEFVSIIGSNIVYLSRSNDYTTVETEAGTVRSYYYNGFDYNMLIWNSSIHFDQLFYVYPNRIDLLILYSGADGVISWVEQNELGLANVAWEPNFWIYNMVFCLIMSLLVGLIHGILQSKLRLYEGGGGLLENFGGIQMQTQPRRTTL